MATVLVADDEKNILQLARMYLQAEGFTVETAANGREALEKVRVAKPDLLVLDLMMPEVDGWEVCRRLRKESDLPIIMLTARGDDVDKIVGLELGADDYMTKPFNARELVARVKAVLRRYSAGRSPEKVLQVGDLRIDPERSRVVLLEAGDRVLAGFDEEASRYAQETLRSRRVDVRVRTPVAEVTAAGARLGSGEWLAAAVVIWAGGVTVDGTLAATLPTAHGRGGRVTLEPDLSVAGHPEVFVVGDAGSVPWGPARPEPCPQVAQVAIQSGRHAAHQIARQLAGRPTAPFNYRDKGLMATIGRHAAVAQLRHGVIVRGTLGWLAWLGLHLVYLVGFRNRVVVLVNWFWRYLDWPSGPRLIVADVDADL